MMFKALSAAGPGVFTLLTVALLAGGCDSSLYDFRVFDDLKDQTWVTSSGPPEGLDSKFYGLALAGGGSIAGDGASFFVVGREQDGFAHLRFGADGTLDEKFVSLSEVNNNPPVNPLPLKPIMAADPASSVAGFAVTAGGGGDLPQQTIIPLLDADTGTITTTGLVFSGEQIVDGLAFGTTNVAGGGKNIVAARGDTVSIIRDIANATADEPSCTHGRIDSFGVAVAEFAASSDMDEIALAVPSAASGGDVMILAGSLLSDAAAAGESNCFDNGARVPLVTVAAPDGEVDFGAVMAVGTFNGGNAPDLVVAAPASNAVYVYLDLDVAAVPTPIKLAIPDEAREFGAALAAGNLDGTDGDELIVGSPGTTLDGKSNAGAAYVFGFSAAEFGPPHVLGDAQPEESQRFGQSVAMVPFGAGREIAVVGADQEVFTYFRARPSDSDVRGGSAQ